MFGMQLDEPGPIDVPRLSLVERADPEPGRGEVLVDVQACAMCRTDLQIVAGDLPAHRMPVIPGHQVVGAIRRVGADVDTARIGQLVGMAWLAGACGVCEFCRSGRENLCLRAIFTGWDRDGGYATSALARDQYAFDLSALASREPASIAPLLCAGVIGYRSLGVAGVTADAVGLRLGLFGYGASARMVLKIARYWGIDTYVVSRSEVEITAALAAGAVWAGRYDEQIPVPLDSAITFAPVGSVVVGALKALDRGGIVAINAIHLDRIPEFNYDDLWWERSLRSVANVTSSDVTEFVDLVDKANITTDFETIPRAAANQGLQRMEAGDVSGSLVLV
ncbi:MAG: zinc-binding alcohol dehydrogenase family protein [Actinomycetes bacterium]